MNRPLSTEDKLRIIGNWLYFYDIVIAIEPSGNMKRQGRVYFSSNLGSIPNNHTVTRMYDTLDEVREEIFQLTYEHTLNLVKSINHE